MEYRLVWFGLILWHINHGRLLLYSDSYHVTSGISEEQKTSCFLSTASTKRSLLRAEVFLRNVLYLCRTVNSSSLRRPYPQALPLLVRVRLIAWRLRNPFLGECRWVPRHFWSHRVSLGHDPAPGPT